MKKYSSFLTQEILKKRFDHLKYKKKECFLSRTSMFEKEDVVQKFVLDQINFCDDKSETNKIESKFNNKIEFNKNVEFNNKKTELELDNSIKSFPYSLENKKFLHFTSSQLFFERNKNIWLQFKIASQISQILIFICDFRNFDFYFEEEIFKLNKPILVVFTKIDLLDEEEEILKILDSESNFLESNNKNNDNLESNQNILENNKKNIILESNNFFENTFKKIKNLKESKNIKFFPFSKKSNSFLNYIKKNNKNSYSVIGYPNVGKSTFLKEITKNKKIKISKSPGKTKFCQGYFYNQENKNIIFYDIPGLVFKRHDLENLIFNNVLNVDQIKIDYFRLMGVILKNIELSEIIQKYLNYQKKEIIFKNSNKNKIDSNSNKLKIDSNKLKTLKTLKSLRTLKNEKSLKINYLNEKMNKLNLYDSILTEEEILNFNFDKNFNFIFYEKLVNLFKKERNWSRETFFRRIIKDSFEGKLQRKNK